MSISAILLRVVLCIGLVLNGSGHAVAATQMQVKHLAAVSAAMQTTAAAFFQDAAVQPCHEDPSTTGVVPAIAGTGENPANPEIPTPDCCKSMNCAGVCAQHAFATMPGLSAGTLVIDHASSVRPMRTGHPAPALPHLIRPPIGQAS